MASLLWYTHIRYVKWLQVAAIAIASYCMTNHVITKVDKEWEAGRHEAARNASKAAIWLNILSFVGGIMLYIGLLIAPIAIVA